MNKAPKNDVLDNKIDLSLLPMDVIGEELVKAYFEGCIKYKRDSWRLGFDYSQMIAAARRHINAFWDKGEDLDSCAVKDFGIDKHHLAGAMFCLVSIMYMQREGMVQYDDRVTKTKDTSLIYPTLRIKQDSPCDSDMGARVCVGEQRVSDSFLSSTFRSIRRFFKK
jgi:hypothetical protein